MSLSKTVSQLAGDTARIQANLSQRVSSAAKNAMVGEEILNEAEKLGGSAMRATARGATAAVDAVEAQIKRNPSIAVLIALGFGGLLGLLSRK